MENPDVVFEVLMTQKDYPVDNEKIKKETTEISFSYKNYSREKDDGESAMDLIEILTAKENKFDMNINDTSIKGLN